MIGHHARLGGNSHLHIDYAQHIGKQTVFNASAFMSQEIVHSKNAQCNKMEST